jgi:DNA-directed RNA polymerase specialized sigma24 family protein
MVIGRSTAVMRQTQRMCGEGNLAELSDTQLLERFVSRRDELAFEALMTRHGPTVLGVCRQVLRDEHDVADAFQAALLMLVRRAGSIRECEVLVVRIYQVSFRIAVRTRSSAPRRRTHETRRAQRSPTEDRHDPGTGEVAPAIHAASGPRCLESWRISG